jgi:hypothetical protein
MRLIFILVLGTVLTVALCAATGERPPDPGASDPHRISDSKIYSLTFD